MSLLKQVGRVLQKLYQKAINKLISIYGTPQSISRGFATGVAVSFTPFVGFHLIIALVISKFNHQNKYASALGTIAGNPWTFPIIWYLTWHTGIFILNNKSLHVPEDFIFFFKELYHAVIMLDFQKFISDIWPIFYPMLVGCLPWLVVIWWLSYKILMNILTKRLILGGKVNDTGNRL